MMVTPYLLESLLVLSISLINSCIGYDGTAKFEGRRCQIEFLYLTQYQRYLVTWKGQRYLAGCSYYIHGTNDDNVVTTFRVCFKKLKSTFDTCHPFVRYIDGLNEESAEIYNCSNPIPDLWCSKVNNYAQIDVNSEVNTNTVLEIEAYATADISLSVGAAVGISFGILAFLGIAFTLCIICLIRMYRPAPNRGKVIRTREEQGADTGNQVIGNYPMQAGSIESQNHQQTSIPQ